MAGRGAQEVYIRRDSEQEARNQKFLRELASANPERRNWKGIFISVFVIAAFCGLILLAVVLVSPDTFKDGDVSRAIHLDDLLKTDAFQPRRFNGTWISDHEFVYVYEGGGVNLYNAENQTTTEVLDAASMEHLYFHSISSDRQYALLIERNSCPLWDQESCSSTTSGKYFIVHLNTRRKKRLSLNGSTDDDYGMREPPSPAGAVFCCGIWSPRGHGLAAVHENDVYYFPSPFDGRDCRRLTVAGSGPPTSTSTNASSSSSSHTAARPSSVLNGNPDYLYTARMYGDRPAIWLNDNGTHLVYLRQDNSAVDEIHLPIFEKPTPPVSDDADDESRGEHEFGGDGEADEEDEDPPRLVEEGDDDDGRRNDNGSSPSATTSRSSTGRERRRHQRHSYSDQGQQQPKWKTFHFPMVGRNSPKISVHLVSILDGSSVSWDPEDPRCQYVLEIKWVNSTHAVVLWTNRKQNLYVSCLHDVFNSSKCREIYKQEMPEDSGSWIPHSMRDGSSLFFSDDSQQMLILAQILDGDKGHFTHVVIVDLATTRSTPVTHGPFDVHRIASWDPSTDLLYYIASPEGRPSERHLYVTKYEPRNFIEPRCITCTDYSAQAEQNRRSETQKAAARARSKLVSGAALRKKLQQQSAAAAAAAASASASSSKQQLGQLPTISDPPCLYCDAQFSHASSFFVLECLGPGIPTAEVYAVTKIASSGSPPVGAGNNFSVAAGVASGSSPSTDAAHRRHPQSITAGDDDRQRQQLRQQAASAADGSDAAAGRSSGQQQQQPSRGVSHGGRLPAAAADTRWVASWETNEPLRRRTEPLELPIVRRFDIPVDNGFVAHVELLLPLYANTEEEDVFQYPLVIAMPQEPGEQQVTEEWDEVDWLLRLSVVKRWIVMRVDLRGSGGEGRAREAEVSRNVGRAETKDLQTVIRSLLAKFSFFNPEKICLCGWGISGFYVLKALAEDGVEHFNCGIAVAPMANWMIADAYLGERIMGFPNLTENVMGFIENDVRKMSPRMQGKDLLVIHGTADPMVLVHNSMTLFRALVQNHVIFHEMIYPDEGHELKGVISHMHSAMESFLQSAFGVAEDDEDQVSNFLAAAVFG